jgi:hypothetical protein
MRDLSNDERNLLRHYCERGWFFQTDRLTPHPISAAAFRVLSRHAHRVINTRDRTSAHQHLLGVGYIEEHAVNIDYLRISVTEAGRQALRSSS